MCGIAGILSATAVDMSAVFAMTQVQKHRGPDGSGHLLVRHGEHSPIVDTAAELTGPPIAQLALGHRRLAIVDCSPAGRQPMSYANNRFWISFNGEIYNYIELREELRGLGHQFVSGSDTEVLLAAFSAWGTACFARFNGMWGLAIWDAAKRELTLARDRLGVKPLYLSFAENRLIFASEIKGVLASGLVRPTLNRDIALDYFVHEVVNQSNASFFQGIEAFPAGCFAVVSAERPTQVKPEPYWQLQALPNTLSFEAATERFRELFESSIRLRMRSDVPVGSCLSGGLDSSAIVCEMARLFPNDRIRTFTSGFADPRFDETAWSRIVSDSINADAHFAQPNEQSFIDELGDLVWHQDEPFFSTSVYAQWCVMRSARGAGVPVLLDGQGADEVLLGYKKFYFFYLQSLLSKGRLLSALKQGTSLVLHGDRGALRWREAMRYLPPSLRPSGGALSDYLISPRASNTEQFHKVGSAVSMQQRQSDDLLRFSVPGLLRYEDRNSMAWSIESRVPFLDYRLVEFLLGLPVEFKLRGGLTKALMRNALADLLPAPILKRRDKMGFVTPQSLWMQGRLGSQLIDEIKQSKLLASLVDTSSLVRTWQAAPGGLQQSMQAGVFRAGLFAMWARRFAVN